MRILISGITGLVGSSLAAEAQRQGHEVCGLSRSSRAPNHILWNPDRGELDAGQLEGFDAVIHLAGDNISEGRWTEAKKKRIRDSRVNSTELLASKLAGLQAKPRVFVSASAIGFYGDQADKPLDEQSSAGTIFLSGVCNDWEQATRPAWESMRVVQTRIGVVLTPKGGALAKMLTPFRMGAGGIIGSGRQYMSWVALPDVVGGLLHAVQTDSLHGVVNLVSPQPVTNYEFTKTLGKVLHRPTIFPMPAFAARLAFGQMADELLLASARVLPRKLEASHYAFQMPQLESALRQLLAT